MLLNLQMFQKISYELFCLDYSIKANISKLSDCFVEFDCFVCLESSNITDISEFFVYS